MLSLLPSANTNTAVTEMDPDVVKAIDGVSGYFNQTGEASTVVGFLKKYNLVFVLIVIIASCVLILHHAVRTVRSILPGLESNS